MSEIKVKTIAEFMAEGKDVDVLFWVGSAGSFDERAKSFEKNDIWDALTNRHCYATTGERILVDFKMGNKIMGDVFSYTGKRSFRLKIIGTSPIEKVLLKRKEKIIDEKIISSYSSEHSNRYRILWEGCTKRGTSRHQKLPWDGYLKTSS